MTFLLPTLAYVRCSDTQSFLNNLMTEVGYEIYAFPFLHQDTCKQVLSAYFSCLYLNIVSFSPRCVAQFPSNFAKVIYILQLMEEIANFEKEAIAAGIDLMKPNTMNKYGIFHIIVSSLVATHDFIHCFYMYPMSHVCVLTLTRSGLILDHLGLTPTMNALLQLVFKPLSSMLFPHYGGAHIDSQHSFIAAYRIPGILF